MVIFGFLIAVERLEDRHRSAAPTANAAREMMTVTAFGPAGWWVPATPIPSNTRFPVWAAVKTFPKVRK